MGPRGFRDGTDDHGNEGDARRPEGMDAVGDDRLCGRSAGRDKSGKILGNSLSFITALESILKDTKYSPMISAFKFFCYSECVLSKYVVGSGIDLTEVKAWNSSQNYRALKNITFGKKQKLKFFLVRNRFFGTLKLLYKIKK